MDLIILQYIREILAQLRKKIWWLFTGFAIVSVGLLVVGMMYNPKYETAITIYADNQNVIKPLLEGQAAVTMPRNERIRIVQEIMFAPRILEQVLRATVKDREVFADQDSLERAMKGLRENISITAPADDYIKVAYSHKDPEVSYQTVNKIVNMFIEESAKTKRSESKSAYTFIDEQVKSYKAQLVEAENKLKAFEAANIDGVESQVNASIARLQATIDETAVDIEAGEVRIAALEEQLAKESRYASSDYSARVYRERLAQLESQLDTALLNLRENHPDVVDLKLQIQDLKRTIVDVENTAQTTEKEDLTGERHLNPIYEELSNRLAEARVNVQTMRHRMAANQKRLEEQFERRRRVAANQAELSELTRDYDVTRNIYEDLLERKERARISMTLDLAGQGVTYKVLEPAVFPMVPTGLRFVHFAIIGPIAGSFLSLGALIAWILLDPRVRFPEQLESRFPGVVLVTIPSTQSQAANGRRVWILFAVFAVMYGGAAVAFQLT